MAHAHLTLEQLVALRDGRLSPEELVSRWVRHLRETCPECGEAFRRLDEYRREKRRTDPARYATALARLAARTPEMEAAVEAERQAAQADLALLLDLELQGRRLARIRGTVHRMNTVALVDLLLDKARIAVGSKPRTALGLLECAAAVVARLPAEAVDSPRRKWLALRVEAHRANALRVLGDLVAADSLWRSLNDQLELWPAGTPDEDAELWSLEASLRIDLRQFDEARRLLARAERQYRLLQDPVGLAKTLIKSGLGAFHDGQPEAAAEAYLQAARLLNPAEHPRLFWNSQHNLADCLVDLGRPGEANRILAEAMPAFQLCRDSSLEMRLDWIHGRIARAEGRLAEATRLLQAAVNACIDQNLDYDAALAHLDITESLLAQGETAEVKRLARAMEPVFRSKKVHREAAAALLLYQEAALAERVAPSLIAELRRYLLLARNDPTFAFPGRSEEATDPAH